MDLRDSETQEKLQHFNFKKFLNEVQSEIKSATDQFATLQQEHKQAMEEEIKMNITQKPQSQSASSPCEEVTPYYVRNEESNVHHRPFNHGITIQPLLWSTKCGWKFGFSTFTIEQTLEGVKAKHICSTCLPKERKEKRSDETSSSSISDASSSSSNG